MDSIVNDEVTTFEMPKGIEVVTSSVYSDEPCFYLGEVIRLSKSGKTLCRYQILKVIRNDRLVTACIYLGPASKFLADEFQLIGGSVDDEGKGWAVHTVAELQEGAEDLRSRPPHRELEPWDLDAAFKNHVEERIKTQNHRSTSGRYVTIERK